MSFQPPIEALQACLDSIPADEHAEVAARMGIAVDDLLEHAIDATGVYDEILIERGDCMTPEEAEAFVEHCMCEYA